MRSPKCEGCRNEARGPEGTRLRPRRAESRGGVLKEWQPVPQLLQGLQWGAPPATIEF